MIPGPLRATSRAEQREDAHRSELDDCQGQRLDDLEHAVDYPVYGLDIGSVETGEEETEEEGEDDDRQHIPCRHRRHDVVRDHPHQELGQGLRGGRKTLREASRSPRDRDARQV